MSGNQQGATPPGSPDIEAETSLDRAKQALEAARNAAIDGGREIPPDLAEGGWRWVVLHELSGLRDAILADYNKAMLSKRRQAWEYRWGGPVATGLGAGVGSVMTAVGASLASSNTFAGWTVIILGFLFAVFASVVTSNNYVYNRNKTLRFERLLFDMADYGALLLPTASAKDVYAQVDQIRHDWETAGA